MQFFPTRPSVAELEEREILALAISAEEEDGKIYSSYAAALRDEYPATAAMFEDMAQEEDGHRQALIARFRERFGDEIPLVRRQDVRGFTRRRPYWMRRPLGVAAVRAEAAAMEQEAARFYEKAASMAKDASTRKLLGDLAAAERGHEKTAEAAEARHLGEGELASEGETERRQFILQIVQPGLAGLMDGSVSTLAPLFAAAFATHDTWETFLVGLAAAVGAGISMGFAEALSDDGEISGRGSPWIRGVASGLMTAAGGLGHALPYLIPDFMIATVLAIAVVIAELAAISWMRWRYMDTPPVSAALQVAVGGALVFAAGLIIGSA